MSILLTNPSSGISSGTTPLTAVVTPTSTVSIDALDTTTIRSAKWFVTITNTTTNEVRAFEVYATHRNGANPLHTVYAVIGDAIDHVLDVVIVGVNLELQVTNNEAVNITVDATQVVTYI